MVVKQFFGEYAPYCFSCGSDKIREQDDEYICASCGCVLSAVAPNNVVKSRVPVLDSRLGTGLSRKFDWELEGLNKLNKELWSDRTESEILVELRRITSTMNLPHMVATLKRKTPHSADTPVLDIAALPSEEVRGRVSHLIQELRQVMERKKERRTSLGAC